jgi:hypothetical protein
MVCLMEKAVQRHQASNNTVTQGEGQDSAVVIATRYALVDPGIEFQCGRDFSHPSRPVLWPTRPPVQWVAILFPRVKAAGAWR